MSRKKGQKTSESTNKPKPPATRNPKTKFQKSLVLLEIIIKMFK